MTHQYLGSCLLDGSTSTLPGVGVPCTAGAGRGTPRAPHSGIQRAQGESISQWEQWTDMGHAAICCPWLENQTSKL